MAANDRGPGLLSIEQRCCLTPKEINLTRIGNKKDRRSGLSPGDGRHSSILCSEKREKQMEKYATTITKGSTVWCGLMVVRGRGQSGFKQGTRFSDRWGRVTLKQEADLWFSPLPLLLALTSQGLCILRSFGHSQTSRAPWPLSHNMPSLGHCKPRAVRDKLLWKTITTGGVRFRSQWNGKMYKYPPTQIYIVYYKRN